jgi:hypothetical protein
MMRVIRGRKGDLIKGISKIVLCKVFCTSGGEEQKCPRRRGGVVSFITTGQGGPLGSLSKSWMIADDSDSTNRSLQVWGESKTRG